MANLTWKGSMLLLLRIFQFFSWGCLCLPQIYKGDPRPRILPHVMASSATGLKLGSCFLPTSHAKTNAKQMHPRSSRTVRHFAHVYLHAQTAVDAGDIRTWRTKIILIAGKNQHPNFSPHAGLKMAQVLGSPLYIFGAYLRILKLQFHQSRV